jgi:hypothetical protein
MSLQQGSFSLLRYRVLGRRKNLTVAELNQDFFGFQAAPLNLTKSAYELRCGWELPLNPELEDSPNQRREAWDISDCLFEEGILLRMRIERKTIPSQFLQGIVLQRWRNRDPAQADEDNTRTLKKQIHDEVREELLQQALPSVSYVDAYWKDQDDIVYLFSQSKMAQNCFEELFRKSFGDTHNLSLFRILPPLLGLPSSEWNNPERDSPHWERLTMTLPARPGNLSLS